MKISKNHQQLQLRLYRQIEKIGFYEEKTKFFNKNYFYNNAKMKSSLSNQILLNKDIKIQKLKINEIKILTKSNSNFFNSFSSRYNIGENMKNSYVIANLVNELVSFLEEKYEDDPDAFENAIENVIIDDIYNAFKGEEIKLTPLQLENVLEKMNLANEYKDQLRYSLLELFYDREKLRK